MRTFLDEAFLLVWMWFPVFLLIFCTLSAQYLLLKFPNNQHIPFAHNVLHTSNFPEWCFTGSEVNSSEFIILLVNIQSIRKQKQNKNSFPNCITTKVWKRCLLFFPLSFTRIEAEEWAEKNIIYFCLSSVSICQLLCSPSCNTNETVLPLQLLYIHRIMLNCKNIPTAHFFTHSTQSL
jgi:hypothetical protein